MDIEFDKKKDNIYVTAYLTRELMVQVNAACKKHNCTASAFVRGLIKAFFQAEKEKGE